MKKYLSIHTINELDNKVMAMLKSNFAEGSVSLERIVRLIGSVLNRELRGVGVIA